MSKQPPYTDQTIIDYERQLLGAYIEGEPISEHITEMVFYSSFHKTVFPIIHELKENGLDLNIIILVAELRKRNLPEKAGGASYVSDLTTAAMTSNTCFYENEVLKAHRGRMLYRAIATGKENLEGGLNYEEVGKTIKNTIETMTLAGSRQDAGILFKDLVKKNFCLITGLLTVLLQQV
jgi:replicative DNA helicase